MNVQEAYNSWAQQYDSNLNKTRDLEAAALRSMLAGYTFNNCLEIGCGTGKNTAWLLTKSTTLTAVDFSAEMLTKAKEKITASHVNFIEADILQDWSFAKEKYDLVSFSLVLEHIENLTAIFEKISAVTAPNSLVYIGELHPFKQFTGSKARFATEDGEQLVTCFNHHVTDFTTAAAMHGFELINMQEFFDEDDRNSLPRIICFLFRFK